MKRVILAGVVVAFGAAFVLLAGTLVHPAAAEPTQVVQAYLTAWESRDIDLARQYYPTARPLPPDFQLEVGALHTRGDEVTWVQTVRPPQGRRPARQPIGQQVTARVRDGQIVSLGTEQVPISPGSTRPATAEATTVSMPQTIGVAVALAAAIAGLLLLRTPRPIQASEMQGRMISGLRHRLDEGWTPFA